MNPYDTINLTFRVPEKSEIISGEEARKYGARKDNRALTTRLVAFDILEKVPAVNSQCGGILEVCCGTGDLTKTLYDLTHNSNITGTDGSKILIEEAKSRYPYLNFEVKNVHSKSKEKYDLVVCKDAFHHFFDSKKGLVDLMDKVKPGGFLYIFDLNRDASQEDIYQRGEVIINPHEKMRFLQSLNASLTVSEFSTLLIYPKIRESLESATIYYPLSFSDSSLGESKDLIKNDKTGEHKLHTLFSAYLLRRKR